MEALWNIHTLKEIVTVLIIDYGMSNLGSIKRSLEECGDEVVISDDPHDLRFAERIVLPGVGSFCDGMNNLQKKGWVPLLKKEIIRNKIPLLGICLGMQLLATTGYEGGIIDGLDFVPGEVVKFKCTNVKERIPHIGWNEINIVKESPILFDIKDRSDFYFVHSYHFVPTDKMFIAAKTPYFGEFVSVIQNQNVFGTQFHPEKSQSIGFKLLKNFLEYEVDSIC